MFVTKNSEHVFDLQAEIRTCVCTSNMTVVHCTARTNAYSTQGVQMVYKRELTARQRQILDFIRSEIHRRGFPPSVREIGEAVGLSSSSTVHSHLAALEAKGLLRRDPSKPRALEVLDYRDNERGIDYESVQAVPLVGQVAAGAPILAAENIEATLPLPISFAGEGTFILRVKGDSMIDAGILDGDFVVVQQQSHATNGDIVVALLDEDATVKRFYREDGRVRLQPENSAMDPIYVGQDASLRILGRVVALFRRI